MFIYSFYWSHILKYLFAITITIILFIKLISITILFYYLIIVLLIIILEIKTCSLSFFKVTIHLSLFIFTCK